MKLTDEKIIGLAGEVIGLNPDGHPYFDANLDEVVNFARAILKEAGVEELELDAERYRWLQNNLNETGPVLGVVWYWSDEYRGMARFEFEQLDKINALIDAEIMKAK